MENQEQKEEDKKVKNTTFKNFFWILIVSLIIYGLLDSLGVFCKDTYVYDRVPTMHKPVIYLYPEKKTDIFVNLKYDGIIFADYPKYNDKIKGWNIEAYPNSKIINKDDNKEYSYLFWEGISYKKINWNIDRGFVVKGSESREFLQNILPQIGLTPKEYNEFIVYWYPIMQKNSYNLISFAGKQYTDTATLLTKPEYTSSLRVFMLIKPLDKPIKIKPQVFDKFERKGFTLVEWGGTVLE